MRFLRHGGIYRSDVFLLLVNSGQGAASLTSNEEYRRPCRMIRSPVASVLRPSAPAQAIGRAGRNAPCPSSTMSSGRLFLEGLLASIALLRFTGHDQHKAIAVSKGINYHRTVTSVLTGCLTSRSHPRESQSRPVTQTAPERRLQFTTVRTSPRC